MRIVIETIKHKDQRYPTCGDWKWDGNDLHISVSEMRDSRHELLVAVHELVEAILCREQGVTEQSVTDFDVEFEKQRKKSITMSTQEPGDNRFAPYRNQHSVATGVERILAGVLDVRWQDYEVEVNSL